MAKLISKVPPITGVHRDGHCSTIPKEEDYMQYFLCFNSF